MYVDLRLKSLFFDENKHLADKNRFGRGFAILSNTQGTYALGLVPVIRVMELRILNKKS